MNAKIVTYYKEAKYVYYEINKETLEKYSFINDLLNEDLTLEERLDNDYEVLNEYNQAGLDCESVFKTKEIINKINERKASK